MIFSASALLKQLQQLSHAHCLWVAFSGGCDSHVLLHALAQLKAQLPDQFPATRIRALHINHGLADEADDWAEHCQSVCDQLAIHLMIVAVDALPDRGESTEAAARAARYHVFSEVLEPGDGLLLAHHEDDQAETLLLQLFRGAGVKGLSSMPVYTGLAKGWLARPLLGFSRQSLRDYATEHGLHWIDDPSNDSLVYDRNFLRQQIIPPLQQRWPSLNSALSRAAGHQSSASRLLDQLAEIDAQACQSAQPDGASYLSVSGLLKLAPERRDNLLRYWIRQQGFLMPDTVHLARISQEVLSACESANPEVNWANASVRRYRDDLCIAAVEQDIALSGSFSWDLDKPLCLNNGRILNVVTGIEKGLRADLATCGKISVRFRQGGEKCRPVGRGHHHSLKKLMQEWAIPPWKRDQVPLVYVDDKIAQIVGYCICEPWQNRADEKGLLIIESGSSLD
ncbi:MAG: tRNA lysidine(34) synthetase TilS [Gammaproteobacteria bacterium]|nr:tRNA lysidine(34) synthetase TilS [Gammaproteobacteria bacterium]